MAIYPDLGHVNDMVKNKHTIVDWASYLVGSIPTPLKNVKVSEDDYYQYMEKQKHVPNHQSDIRGLTNAIQATNLYNINIFG
jgi:hypothetical protein